MKEPLRSSTRSSCNKLKTLSASSREVYLVLLIFNVVPAECFFKNDLLIDPDYLKKKLLVKLTKRNKMRHFLHLLASNKLATQ